MNLARFDIAGPVLIEPRRFADSRGFFSEVWKASTHAEIGITRSFVQDNHSLSRLKGTLRGLHFQRPPTAQGKLVRCVRGAIFDVAVDIRRSSPHFGQWVGVHLSAENKRQVWVPPGFAHGFAVLSASAEFLYKTTDYYAPTHERCIVWNDPDLAIDWPLQNAPLLAAKDAQAPVLAQAEVFV
jgi:dTDP-4-dehydrorhamnose 3,5-epimerase